LNLFLDLISTPELINSYSNKVISKALNNQGTHTGSLLDI